MLCRPVNARPSRSVLAVVTLSVLVCLGTGVFLVVRPDRPPITDLATAMQLAKSGQIARGYLNGDTLFITETSGQQVRVERTTAAQFRALEQSATQALPPGQPLSFGEAFPGGDWTDELGPLILGPAITIAFVVLIWCLWRVGIRRSRKRG